MPLTQKILLFFFPLFPVVAGAQKDLTLWYSKPAATWTEALPVGNGRLGAMIFGRPEEELIQLNEATLWSGGPVKKGVNPAAYTYLPEVREALFKGDNGKAEALVKKMQGLYTESFLPLGDVVIKQVLSAPLTDYYRDLNINDAVAATKFRAGGIDYRREVLASAPDQVIVVKFTASRSNSLSVKISAGSLLRYRNEAAGNDLLLLKGKAPSHVDPSYYNAHKEPVIYDDSSSCRGMRFALLMKAVQRGGTVTTDTSGVSIKAASEITLYLSAATSFNGFDKCPDKEGKDEVALARQYLAKAVARSYQQIFAAHLADFHRYFNRVSLELDRTDSTKNAPPTVERLAAYTAGGKDPGLEALYFQYGRYLLISSSRTPSVPANLQGIWNKELRAPWSSNYTSNINVQMNYWPVEAANLPEMHGPLFGLIKNLSATGADVAKEFYKAQGWVTHHNTDIWGLANPVGDVGKGDPKWANWQMGGAWLCRHLWEHYLYTGDKKFLEETAYPLMKSAALFMLDWLVQDSAGHWVTAPSTSPENDFSDGREKHSVSVATTMDMSIVRDLFKNLIDAGAVLNISGEPLPKLLSVYGKLYPFRTGSKGQLQEWYKDYEDVDPHHRHVSHLYGLYPGNQISPLTTPDLSAAAKRSLEIRGDEGTGWSLAWKVNLWARLLDGNHAYKLYRNLLRLTAGAGTNYSGGGGVYANLFDAHPPFQIDGNFGGAAGITEMLLQSQAGELHLLPALPDAWKQGTVKGLVGRGNYVVDISWNDGKLQGAGILARAGGDWTVRTNIAVAVESVRTTVKKEGEHYLTTFKAVKGKRYKLTAKS